MFLRSLKNEEKELFLGLAYEAANANGIIEDSEELLINGFAEELGIPAEAASKLGYNEICNRLLKIASRKELIQISFEILGVMMGDTKYDQGEKKFIRQMTNIFGISEDLLVEMEECLDEYNAVYKKIVRLINS